MSSHEKALDKATKHVHKMGANGRCKICNVVMKGPSADDKGSKPTPEFGAKNNDSEED